MANKPKSERKVLSFDEHMGNVADSCLKLASKLKKIDVPESQKKNVSELKKRLFEIYLGLENR